MMEMNSFNIMKCKLSIIIWKKSSTSLATSKLHGDSIPSHQTDCQRKLSITNADQYDRRNHFTLLLNI